MEPQWVQKLAVAFANIETKLINQSNTKPIRPWQTRTHCCRHIVAHDVSWAVQTGKHLLRTQNVSVQNQKHFLCCVRNKCCARGQTGKHLCRQQCILVCQGL